MDNPDIKISLKEYDFEENNAKERINEVLDKVKKTDLCNLADEAKSFPDDIFKKIDEIKKIEHTWKNEGSNFTRECIISAWNAKTKREFKKKFPNSKFNDYEADNRKAIERLIERIKSDGLNWNELVVMKTLKALTECVYEEEENKENDFFKDKLWKEIVEIDEELNGDSNDSGSNQTRNEVINLCNEWLERNNQRRVDKAKERMFNQWNHIQYAEAPASQPSGVGAAAISGHASLGVELEPGEQRTRANSVKVTSRGRDLNSSDITGDQDSKSSIDTINDAVAASQVGEAEGGGNISTETKDLTQQTDCQEQDVNGTTMVDPKTHSRPNGEPGKQNVVVEQAIAGATSSGGGGAASKTGDPASQSGPAPSGGGGAGTGTKTLSKKKGRKKPQGRKKIAKKTKRIAKKPKGRGNGKRGGAAKKKRLRKRG